MDHTLRIRHSPLTTSSTRLARSSSGRRRLFFVAGRAFRCSFFSIRLLSLSIKFSASRRIFALIWASSAARRAGRPPAGKCALSGTRGLEDSTSSSSSLSEMTGLLIGRRELLRWVLSGSLLHWIFFSRHREQAPFLPAYSSI